MLAEVEVRGCVSQDR